MISTSKESLFSKFTSFITIVSLVFITSFAPQFASVASATGYLTSLSDTLSPATGAFNAEKASTVANHTIVFTTPTGVAAGATIILTFDNGTSIPAPFGPNDVDLKDNGTNVALAATASGTTWGVTRTSTTVITFTNGSNVVTAGHTITILLGTNASFGATGTNQITNGTAGVTLLSISGTFGDTGTIGIPIVSNDVVTVNAIVVPTVSFTLSSNALYFGNLRTAGPCFAQNTDPGSVTCPTTTEAEAFNMTAATNATSGYAITVQGTTLTSGANTIPALATNTASAPGTSQFGIRLTATGGTGTITAPYAAAGYAFTATATTPAQIASATGPSATTTYSDRYMANISASQAAGTYTASHTYTLTATY
ncbi:MAG: hypothetical protein KGI58_03785 [Patescibacteria group bacterium]|nr:hypothetical protein [Patescibacteria group bacterium]